MRILHLIHRSWPYHGGSERYVLEHAIRGRSRGHESTIFTTDAWDMSWLVSRRGRHLEPVTVHHRGVEIVRFPVAHPPAAGLLRGLLRRLAHGGPDRYFYPNPFVPGLARGLARWPVRFDLVHANAMPFLIYHGYRHALRTGAALVTVPHLNYGEPFRPVQPAGYFEGMQPRILRQSNLVVAQSRFERQLYLERGVHDERIMILGSGIEPEELAGGHASRARARFGIPPGPVLLSLTGHSLDRGSGHLLEAVTRLWKRGLGFSLVLAGPIMDDFRRELDGRAGRLASDASAGRLIVTGYIREEDRADLLAASSVVVQASRQDAFGIVLLDAWMCGSPVVACWCGGMPDIVEEGVNGFLVPFGDSATLGHRIRTLLEDERLRSSMAAAGREMVLGSRTWRRVTDRFFDRIEEMEGCR